MVAGARAPGVSNLPMGLNFLALAYAHSQGGLSTDPSLPLTDAHLKIDTGLLAYVRGVDLWGKPGKFDVIVPYSHLSGTALVAGQPAAPPCERPLSRRRAPPGRSGRARAPQARRRR